MFMKLIMESDVLEIVLFVFLGKECWFLFFFGVYYLWKLDKICGVFDLLVSYEGFFFNSVLLLGFNLMNDLFGILLCFCMDKVVIMVDI